MGWLRLVGSFKIQVFFAEISLFLRALLQKRLEFLGSLLIVATSYLSASSLSGEEALKARITERRH